MGEYEAGIAIKETTRGSRFRITVLRLHNVYGTYMGFGNGSQALPSLIRKAINYPESERFLVWGSGAQYRDFVFVDDVVNALLLARFNGMSRGAIQIGTGAGITLLDAATIIKAMAEAAFGGHMPVEFTSAKPEGDRGRVANPERARQILRWRPRVPITEGLAHSFVWIAKQIFANRNTHPNIRKKLFYFLGEPETALTSRLVGVAEGAYRKLLLPAISADLRPAPNTWGGIQFVRKLSILYVDGDAKPGAEIRYYFDYVTALKKIHSLCLYLPRSQADNPLKAKACSGQAFDIVVIGFGMLNLHPGDEILPWLRQVSNIPIVVMFNKEYQDLEKKIAWVQSHSQRIMCLFTVQHKWREYSDSTGLRFYRLPFAVDPKLFDLRAINPSKVYKYDLGFTGTIRQGQMQNWRSRIMQELKPKLEHAGIRIFHADFLAHAEYRKKMAQTKIWISTLSIGDLVNPRYFEVMASGTTLLMCNRESNGAYEDMGFEDGTNVAMFSSLDEFYDVALRIIQRGETDRKSMVNRARQHVLHHHSYSRRAESWTSTVLSELSFPDKFAA